MLDTLLRCLRVPTAPPRTSTAELFAAWWLDDIAAVAERRAPKRLTWAQCERPRDAVGLIDAAAIGNAVDWPHLRTLATLDQLPGRIDAHLAAWMDDGMFSRWLLGQQPTVAPLFDEIVDQLTPAAARRVRHALDALCPGWRRTHPTSVTWA